MLPTKRPKHNKKMVILGISILAITIMGAIMWFVVISSDDNASDMDVSEQESVGDMDIMEPLEEESTENIDDEDGKNLSDIGLTVDDAEKEYYVDYVDLAVLNNGEGIFDIHIRFPDGEDYVVVSGISITGMSDEGIYARLSDRENHMLSSAKTDMDVYNGTQLYLSRYEADSGIVTNPDYPWNQFVLGAHGIAEAEATEIYARRVQLEENLATFMNQTLNK